MRKIWMPIVAVLLAAVLLLVIYNVTFEVRQSKAERELKERRSEVTRTERRLTQREENLDAKEKTLDTKEKNLDKKRFFFIV